MTCLCKPHKEINISSSPRHYNKGRLACGEFDLTMSKTEGKIASAKLFSWVRVPELRVFETFLQMSDVYYSKHKTKQNTAEATKRKMLETMPTIDNSSLDFQGSFHWQTSIQGCSVGRLSNPASLGMFSEMVPVRKCQDMMCHWKRAWSWCCKVIGAMIWWFNPGWNGHQVVLHVFMGSLSQYLILSIAWIIRVTDSTLVLCLL